MRINLLFFFIFCISDTCFSQLELGTIKKNGACFPGKDWTSLPVPQDGNGTLGNIYNASKCGLNYVQSSVRITSRMIGLPGTGLPVTMAVSGIPVSPCVAIEKAFLWFGVSYSNLVGDSPTPSVSLTNPSSVTFNYTGNLVGSDVEKCWGEDGTWSFRNDVTNAITGNGNYVLNISGIQTDNIDGATLLIIYRDGSAAYQGSMVIDDGLISINTFGGQAQYTMSGINVCANTSKGRGFFISGDFQFATHTIYVGPTTYVPIDYFWNFDTVPVALTPSTTSLLYRTYSNYVATSDCFSLNAVGLYFQTTTCTTCPAMLSASITSTPATCGHNNGSATVIPSTTAYAPYSYNWSPSGGSNATATGLAPGNYTVTIADVTGCKTFTVTTTIASSTGLSSVITVPTSVSCNGGNNGSASASPSGGTTPYTYAWSNGQSGSAVSGLSAGTYTVVVTDANGCSSASPVTISQPVAISVSTTVTQSNCGVSNGSATANASGGTPSFAYVWNTVPVQNSSTATGLAAGLYTVMVTDANGCTKPKTVSVSNANGPNTTMSQADILCNGFCTGSASASVSGGSSPYTYQWSNTQTTAAVSSLCAGTYIMVVSDASGCTDAQSVTITEPPVLTTSISTTPEACGQNNGTATANTSGGTPGYTFLWSNGQATSTATGLAVGQYTVTITDANGCSDMQTASVMNQAGLSSTVSQNNILCNGQCNGNASANVTGGSLPYTYLWSNTQATHTATNLCSGTYSVVVSDANGCTTVQSVTITQPSPITVNTTATPASCNASDGSATANALGGTGTLTYSWAPGGQTTSTATGLSAGNYIVTVTDSNGCAQANAITVPSLSNLTSSATQTNVLCNGASSGSATMNANGGTTPYSYNWTGGQATSTASGLSAGTYVCQITDANGCTSTQTVTINEPAALVPATTSSNENCGKADGSANASASGGVGPYTYLWSNAQATSSANGLAAGTYSVLVADANGCTQTATAIVGTNPGPTATVGTDLTIPIGSTANLSAGGGGTYSWSPSADLSCSNCATPIASPQQSTVYCVIVTDTNGCSDSACMKVSLEAPCPDNLTIDLPTAFTPNGDGHNDVFLIAGLNNCVVSYSLVIFDRWGEKVFESTDMAAAWDGIYRGKDLDAAVFVYYFSAVFTNGQSISKKGNITLIR